MIASHNHKFHHNIQIYIHQMREIRKQQCQTVQFGCSNANDKWQGEATRRRKER